MSKKREDEIQQKLVELELSIKDEEAKKQVPAASSNPSTSLAAGEQTEKAKDGEDFDLQQMAGYVLLAISGFMLLAHLQFVPNWGFWGRGPMLGLMVIPLMVGIGMLFYNYKSRMAQFVTIGSLILMMVLVLSSLSLAFTTLSVLDFLLMGVPLCVGGALLVKSYQRKNQGAK